MVVEHLSRAASATSPRTSTRSRSRRTRSGAGRIRSSARSRTYLPRLRREVRPHALHPVRPRGDRQARWDEEDARWEHRDGGRRRSPHASWSAGRAASASRGCPTSRGATRSRARRSTRRSGTTRWTSPARRSPYSARARRRSRSCPTIQPEVEAAARLPAHAAVGRPPLRPADHELRAPRCSAASRPSSAACGATSTGCASCSRSR